VTVIAPPMRVASGSANYTAAKVALNRFYVRPWLYELYAQGREARTLAVARD